MPPRKKKAKAAPKTKKAAANDTADEPEPKKVKYDFFDFTTDAKDPIVENLREVSNRFKLIKSYDTETEEQIALEGLTGVTFGYLCRLLDASIPNLDCIKDDRAQNFIWSMIVNVFMRRISGASIQAYYLNKPNVRRSSPVKQTSTRSLSSHESQSQSQSQQSSESSGKSQLVIEKEIKLPSHTLKRIAKTDWMLHPVQDGHVVGSCAHYLSRTKITQEILDLFDPSDPRKSLSDLNRKYNLDNIYLVADQELRRKMLIPSHYDPNMDISLREYACLELIGRTRSLGIVFPNDKSLGRYRILLTSKQLITQYQQNRNSFIVHHIRKFCQYNLDHGGKPFKQIISQPNMSATNDKKPMMSADDDDDYAEVPLDGAVNSVRMVCCNPRRLKIDCDMLRMVYDVIALSKGRSMWDIRRKLRLPKSHVRNHLKNLVNVGLIGSHTRVIADKVTRIYRARHKSKRRKRKILRGVKAKWDETDLRAREMLGHRRSHFSQAEDSLLILCRITCLLLEPKLNKLSFCVPKQVIRDTLHDELFESHDKTSDALLRRAKFLRKSPEHKMLINELTAELRDDDDIVRLASTRPEAKSDEKLCKLFNQLLRAVRAKLPHLLGLKSSLITDSNRTISIKSSADLKEKFELFDCQMPADSSVDSASVLLARAASKLSFANTTMPSLSRGISQAKLTASKGVKSAHISGRSKSGASSIGHNQPSSALIQLSQPIDNEIQLDLNACKGMKSILSLVSFCTASSFELTLDLKVPVRVVGLDQENESFRKIFERAKESKETTRIIEDLTTPNPTADSRRALFMLRNALKLQSMEKSGKLADALIVRPCDIRFHGDEKIVFSKQHLVDKFAETMMNDRKSMTASRSGDSTAGRRTRFHSGSQMEPRASSSKEVPIVSQNHARETPSFQANLMWARKEVIKLITLLMSWIAVYPGIELSILKVKTMRHLDCERRFLALLDLMEQLELISSERLNADDVGLRDEYDGCSLEPCLFGYKKRAKPTSQTRGGARGRSPTRRQQKVTASGESDAFLYEGAQLIITYEPQANSYVRYCQLISSDQPLNGPAIGGEKSS